MSGVVLLLLRLAVPRHDLHLARMPLPARLWIWRVGKLSSNAIVVREPRGLEPFDGRGERDVGVLLLVARGVLEPLVLNEERVAAGDGSDADGIDGGDRDDERSPPEDVSAVCLVVLDRLLRV